MKVIDIIKADKPALSFEVFPPKTTDTFDSVKHATEEIAKLNPSYMSVTFGAGGSNAGFAVEVAGNLQKNYGVTTVGHLTCIGADRETITNRLEQMKAQGIENILALRGDKPKDWTEDRPLFVDFEHACDLVRHIKSFGDFIKELTFPTSGDTGHNSKPLCFKATEFVETWNAYCGPLGESVLEQVIQAVFNIRYGEYPFNLYV